MIFMFLSVSLILT